MSLSADIPLDLDAPLPWKWRPEVQPYAPLLRGLRDDVRKELGRVYEAGHVTGRFVVAAIKARALDLLAAQPGLDGAAFARAVQSLVIVLTHDPEEQD